jgi:hypothetical protein
LVLLNKTSFLLLSKRPRKTIWAVKNKVILMILDEDRPRRGGARRGGARGRGGRRTERTERTDENKAEEVQQE